VVRKTYIFGIGFPTANRERGQRTGGGGGDMTYGLITCLKFFDLRFSNFISLPMKNAVQWYFQLFRITPVRPTDLMQLKGTQA
jgi:hypothetical protein